MIDFAGYSFDPNKGCFVCQHVLDGHPVLLFAHDEDGEIHFMCGGKDHSVDNLHVICLSHLLEQIRSISEMPTVGPGYMAERSEPGTKWEICTIEDE